MDNLQRDDEFCEDFLDSDGYVEDVYDELGFEEHGYDVDGYDHEGYDRDGIHRDDVPISQDLRLSLSIDVRLWHMDRASGNKQAYLSDVIRLD